MSSKVLGDLDDDDWVKNLAAECSQPGQWNTSEQRGIVNARRVRMIREDPEAVAKANARSMKQSTAGRMPHEAMIQGIVNGARWWLHGSIDNMTKHRIEQISDTDVARLAARFERELRRQLALADNTIEDMFDREYERLAEH